MCDADGELTDAPKDTRLDDSYKCSPHLYITHKSGCPVYSGTAFIVFLQNNPWVLGIVAAVVGLIVTFYGREFFQSVIETIGGGLLFLCLYFCAL